MIRINTVSKPEPPAAEAAGQARRVRAGSAGAADAVASRAARRLLVAGKGRPVRRQLVSAGPFESVIGVDERTQILETELAPWRMICALRMRGPNGGGAVGTGWLAGPRTVVTAGHCVFHGGFFGGWADRIEVSPGRDGDEFPFGTQTATRFSSVDRWVSDEDPDFDIGCIHLDEPVGEDIGWFAIGSLGADELESHRVNISGYPGDRGNGEDQYFHTNRVKHVGERRVFYDVDTAGGQSGAPVWIHEEEGAPPLVIGIHAYGTGGTPFDLGITANSAPRIIPEVFDQIAAWLDADGGGAGDGR